MPNKIDIFKVLSKVDNFDIDYFKSLTDEEKKGIPPYTLMLWMSGCKSNIQLSQINAFLNTSVFELPAAHKDLLYLLACISSDGNKKRYSWVKKKTGNKKFSTTVDIIRRQYKCSTATALSYVSLLDSAFIIDLAQKLGEQDDTLKKIKQEWK